MSLRRSSVTAKTIIWTSTPIRGATIQQQNAIRLRRLEKPTFTAMTPKNYCFSEENKTQKTFPKFGTCHEIHTWMKTNSETQITVAQPQTKKTTRHAHKTLCLSRKNVRSKKQRFENATALRHFLQKSCSRFDQKVPQCLPPIDRRFDHDPSMIRAWNSCSATRPFAEVKKSRFRAPAIFQNRISCETSSENESFGSEYARFPRGVIQKWQLLLMLLLPQLLLQPTATAAAAYCDWLLVSCYCYC